MTNREKYYVEKVAQDARESAEHDQTVQFDFPLTLEMVKRIIEHFGGTLVLKPRSDDVDSNFYIKKNVEEKLEIYYNPEIPDSVLIMKLLHELGHAFFDFDEMSVGQVMGCDGVEPNDQKADLFARAFVMPREQFESDLVNQSTEDGKFDMIQLAKHYGVGFMDTLTRGEDLNLWH